ncbi:hypothetical protein IWQ60_001912 [Tieghemiomyces parasiticus]|uniref:Uncharacterized protein n=1 Tax=Tieghemiomyces parasiticus TaxID=78921 RepID=A0A9W8AIE8_9FUNG|nr:hypothetical protein IWQ60_001912 [Tieghemiomyces parasiticus]
MAKAKKTPVSADAARKKRDVDAPNDSSNSTPAVSPSNSTSEPQLSAALRHCLAVVSDALAHNSSQGNMQPLADLQKALTRAAQSGPVTGTDNEADADLLTQLIHDVYLLSAVYPDLKASLAFTTVEQQALDKLYPFLLSHAAVSKDTYPAPLPAPAVRVVRLIHAGSPQSADYADGLTLSYLDVQHLLDRLHRQGQGQAPRLPFKSILKSAAAEFKPSRPSSKRAETATPTLPAATPFRAMNQFVPLDHATSLRKYIIVPASGIKFTLPSVIFDAPVADSEAAEVQLPAPVVVAPTPKDPAPPVGWTDPAVVPADVPTVPIPVTSVPHEVYGAHAHAPLAPYAGGWAHPGMWLPSPAEGTDGSAGTPGSASPMPTPGSETAGDTTVHAPYLMYPPAYPVLGSGVEGADVPAHVSQAGPYAHYPQGLPYPHASPYGPEGEAPNGMPMGYSPVFDPNWHQHQHPQHHHHHPQPPLPPPGAFPNAGTSEEATEGADMPRHQSTSSNSSVTGNPGADPNHPSNGGAAYSMYPPYSGQPPSMAMYGSQPYPGMPLPNPSMYGHHQSYYYPHPNGPVPSHHGGPPHRHPAGGNPNYPTGPGGGRPRGGGNASGGGYKSRGGGSGGGGGKTSNYYRGGSPNFRGGYRAPNYQPRPPAPANPTPQT